jgi:hypothetical protein
VSRAMTRANRATSKKYPNRTKPGTSRLSPVFNLILEISPAVELAFGIHYYRRSQEIDD